MLHSRRVNKDIRALVKGIMIESYIVDGAQSATCGTYGQSITDPCLGWEKTEKLIYELADIYWFKCKAVRLDVPLYIFIFKIFEEMRHKLIYC